MKGIFILNSDFGIGNTVGSRPYHIYNEIKNKDNLTIFCRDFNKNLKSKNNVTKVIPKGDLIMKGLTYIQIYLIKTTKINILRNNLFEYFLIKKLKKINLNDIDFIHSWDLIPNVYKYIKSINSNIKIYQDMPIALHSILKKLKKEEECYKNFNFEIEDYKKDCFKYVYKYIVPSNFVKQSLINENIDAKKIEVIPFGVDINKFKPMKNKKSKIFNVAFSGNVNDRKGVKYLIESWKELDLKDAKLNIYGRVYPEVLKYFEDNKRYNIKVHGFVNLPKELPKNDLFVFPSLMEGSAKSVYEALSCEIPVVTTLNAGSIVEDGKEGFIIPVQNSKKISEKILYFYNNKNELKKFGKNARKKVENYTWEKYGKNIIKAYGDLK